jgi:hypothetical protein
MAGVILPLLCLGCASAPVSAAGGGVSMAMMSSNSTATTQHTGGWWVLVGDDWVYVAGDMPEICVDTVCAAAGGSTMIAYYWDTFGFDKQIRFVLLESKQAGKVWDPNKRNNEKEFDKSHPSYIDVHRNGNKMEEPKPCDFTLDELTDDKKPTGFNDGLWKRLKGVRNDLRKHGKDLPPPKVGS